MTVKCILGVLCCVLYATAQSNIAHVIVGIPGLYGEDCMVCTPVLRVENSQSLCSAPCRTESTPVGLTHCVMYSRPDCQLPSTLCMYGPARRAVNLTDYGACAVPYSDVPVSGEVEKPGSQAPGLLVSHRAGRYTLSCTAGGTLHFTEWTHDNITSSVPRCTKGQQASSASETALPWWSVAVAGIFCLLVGLLVPILTYKMRKTHKIRKIHKISSSPEPQGASEAETTNMNPYASCNKPESEEYAEVDMPEYSNVAQLARRNGASEQADYLEVLETV